MLVLSGCGSDRDSRTPDLPPGDQTAVETAVPPPAPPDPAENLLLLQAQPPSAEIDMAIGRIFLNQGNLDSALVRCQSATKRNPNDAGTWNLLGICLARMDRGDEAYAAYQKAVGVDPFYPKTYVNQGNLFFRDNKINQAIQAYKVATSIDTTDAVTWINLGLAYERYGLINEAIHAYVKTIECDDASAEPWERLGWIYFEKKLYRSARGRWEEALVRDPSREDLRANIRELQDFADSTGTQ